MKLAVLVCALAVSACIQSGLVPCGDRLCARDAMCIAGSVCANADQLSACAGADEGTVCTLVSGTVGRCTLGVCVPSGCGNMRMDPGEVCDDGNVTAGDGCSGTCDSDEMCGNGVLDAIKGESCDCGADDTRVPQSCTGPNSDDPSSPCTTGCRLRRCGDGEVAGPEQCDGTMMPDGIACTSYGFYTGTVACSALCQFDIAGCSERCGDSIVQTAYEVCDGTPPADQTCLDFGYDLGWLGCTGVCTPGLADCDRLGWARAHQRIATATDVIPRGNRLLVRFFDGKVSLLIDDVAKDPTGTFLATASTETDSYAIAQTSVMHHATDWQALPIAPPWTAQPTYAFASSSLGLFVVVEGDANAYRWNGTQWLTYAIPGGAIAKPAIGGSRTRPYIYDPSGTSIAMWNGAGFAAVTPPANTTTVHGVAETSTALYVATEDGLFGRAIVSSGFGDQGIPALQILANSNDGVDVLTTAGVILRLGNGALQFSAPPGTAGISEEGGRIFVTGVPSGVFAMLKGTWQANDPPAATPQTYTYIHGSGPLKDDVYLVTGPATWELQPGRWVNITVPPGTVDAIRTEDSLVSIDTSLTISKATGSTTKSFSVITSPKMLFYPPTSGKVFIAGDKGAAILNTTSGVLDEVNLNADLKAIHGASATNVFAVGSDRTTGVGVVYRYDGINWKPIDVPLSPFPPLRDVFVSPTGKAYAVTRNTVFFGSDKPSDWTALAVPGADLVSISGTKDDDFFVAGPSQFGFPFSGLAHWDGTHFYPVRLPATAAPRDVFVSIGAVYVLLTDATANRDNVYALVRATRF
ncbi:MAG TPA: hypothetical protein VMZ53_13500 [Kofleriaceae bacterium]|nr:hypothetical protein [Kofleriaceae bacterium]